MLCSSRLMSMYSLKSAVCLFMSAATIWNWSVRLDLISLTGLSAFTARNSVRSCMLWLNWSRCCCLRLMRMSWSFSWARCSCCSLISRKDMDSSSFYLATSWYFLSISSISICIFIWNYSSSYWWFSVNEASWLLCSLSNKASWLLCSLSNEAKFASCSSLKTLSASWC